MHSAADLWRKINALENEVVHGRLAHSRIARSLNASAYEAGALLAMLVERIMHVMVIAACGRYLGIW